MLDHPRDNLEVFLLRQRLEVRPRVLTFGRALPASLGASQGQLYPVGDPLQDWCRPFALLAGIGGFATRPVIVFTCGTKQIGKLSGVFGPGHQEPLGAA